MRKKIMFDHCSFVYMIKNYKWGENSSKVIIYYTMHVMMGVFVSLPPEIFSQKHTQNHKYLIKAFYGF